MNISRLRCLTDFAIAIEIACRADSHGDDESRETWLQRAYEHSGAIRNLSRDERWKAPCNAFRDAYQRRAESGYGPALVAGGELIEGLPPDAEVE